MSEKEGERRSTPGVSKKLWRSGEEVNEKREGVGKKKESPAVDPKHFTELRSLTNGDQ